jgi:hypothetical protein
MDKHTGGACANHRHDQASILALSQATRFSGGLGAASHSCIVTPQLLNTAAHNSSSLPPGSRENPCNFIQALPLSPNHGSP